MFLLTTVFYIQTNEGAGRKIMRDGMGEREWSWSYEREAETAKEASPLAKNRLLKINTVI